MSTRTPVPVSLPSALLATGSVLEGANRGSSLIRSGSAAAAEEASSATDGITVIMRDDARTDGSVGGDILRAGSYDSVQGRASSSLADEVSMLLQWHRCDIISRGTAAKSMCSNKMPFS